ncbi:MAG: flagellar basal body rod C-terminal domain-containing protein [Phenylobacterium sp.]|jgi:flagellar hook protein FlgE|uniref:flagellar basal body rod C-terminal domain-containing protein n=1 Tax=Phenylobacterium sp. TaxID=1871053 RepID=UPI00391C9AAB
MDPIATAAYGMFQASKRFEASALRTAQMGDPEAQVDLVAETVEQIGAKTAFSANAAVVRTADEMNKALLDILA